MIDKQNIIDSRDIVEELARLQDEYDNLKLYLDDAVESGDFDAEQDALEEWNDDNEEYFKELKDLNEEGENYSSEWSDGATLINKDYFEEYCEDLVKDIGDLPKDIPHYIVIDWEATADNIRNDYSEISFGNETYLVRD